MTRLNVDCFNLIFNELENDKHCLHSCLLVNKEWCCAVVPILWKLHSWQNKDESERKLFSTILSFLSSPSKQLLSDNDIILPSTIPPLFHYISFCKFPEAKIIDKIIEMILEEHHAFDKINLLEREIYKLFISQCKYVKELMWRTSQPLPSFPEASACFSQLYYLYIDIDIVNSNSLYEMAQICKDLNTLSIYNCFQDIPGLIALIDAQRNLKSVKINYHYFYNKEGNCKEIGNALSRKWNTIDSFYLRSLRSVNMIPPSFLTSLINLKKISINVEGINDELHQYLSISEFPNLQDLKISGLSCFKELATLIEKTKGNISFVFVNANKYAKNTGMLIKAIANYCPNIRQLFTYHEPKDFIHIKSLLLNCRYLRLIVFNSTIGDNIIGDELLDILTRFSPVSLTDITIADWRYSIDAFERFFESCRERTLLRFDIIHTTYNNNITSNHRAMVTKYINEGMIKYSNCRNW